MGCNSVADITGLSSFFYPLLPPEVSKSREIRTKFDLIAVHAVTVIQSHRSWCQSKADMRLPISH